MALFVLQFTIPEGEYCYQSGLLNNQREVSGGKVILSLTAAIDFLNAGSQLHIYATIPEGSTLPREASRFDIDILVSGSCEHLRCPKLPCRCEWFTVDGACYTKANSIYSENTSMNIIEMSPDKVIATFKASLKKSDCCTNYPGCTSSEYPEATFSPDLSREITGKFHLLF